MPNTVSPLAPLPFGEASAKAFNEVAACTDFLGSLPGSPSRFDAIGRADDFRIKLRPVSLPGVTLCAGTCSPKATDHESERLAVVIPFGDCASVIRAGRHEYRWASPHHAFFIPAGCHIDAESTAGAFLRLDIDAPLLVRTAAALGGIGRRRRILELDEPRVVAMRVRGIEWLPVIQSICASVDAFDCDPHLLADAGIDDLVLRVVATMLRPELVLEEGPHLAESRDIALEPLVARIMASLDGRITMRELESWSGRSTRTIQVAFRKRFGMSPMQWIRDRRLDLARQRLLTAAPQATVREIAFACGFHRMATFIPEFTRRFGELPSQSLHRSRR